MSTEDIRDIPTEVSTEDIRDIPTEVSTEDIRDVPTEVSTEDIRDKIDQGAHLVAAHRLTTKMASHPLLSE